MQLPDSTLRASGWLVVPYGLDESSKLASATQATKGMNYRCPGCKRRLILRQGSKRIWHFAHRMDSTCNGETLYHETAKHLVKQVVNESVCGNGRSPKITVHCSGCGTDCIRDLPPRVSSAEVEYPFREYRLDVALCESEEVVCAIEILHTHKTDRAIDLLTYELRSEDVLGDPYLWRPVNNACLQWLCESCTSVATKSVASPKEPDGVHLRTPDSAPYPGQDRALPDKSKDSGKWVRAHTHGIRSRRARAYCIRCCCQIEYDRDRPYCARCHAKFRRFEDDPNCEETFCHSCGKRSKRWRTSLRKPLCGACYSSTAR